MSESDSEVTPAHLLHLSPLLFDQPIPETPSVPEHENRRRISLLSARRSDVRPSFITRLLKEFERDAPERRHSFSLAVQAVADATTTSRRNSVNPSCIGSEDAAARENSEDATEQIDKQEPVPPAPTRTLEVDVGTNLDIFGHRRKDVRPWAQTPTPTRTAQIPFEESTVTSSPLKAVHGVPLPVEPVGSAPAAPSIAVFDSTVGVTNSENDANLAPTQDSRDPTPEPTSPDQQPEGEESPAPLIVEEPTNTEIEANDGFEPLHPEGLSTILEEDSVLEAFTPVKHHNLPTRSSPMKPSSPLPLGHVTLGTPAVGASSPAGLHQEGTSLQELPSEAPSSPTPFRRPTPEKFGFGAQPSANSHRRYSAAHELLTEVPSPVPTAEKSAVGALSPATSQQESVDTEEELEGMPSEIEAARQTTPESHDNDASAPIFADNDDKVSDDVPQDMASSPALAQEATPETAEVCASPAVSSHLESTAQDESVEEVTSGPTSPHEVTPEIANIDVSCSAVKEDGNDDQPSSEDAVPPSSPAQQANSSPLVADEDTITVETGSPRSATPMTSISEAPVSPTADVEDSTSEEKAEDTPAAPSLASPIRSDYSVGRDEIEEHKEEPPADETPIQGENDDAARPIEPNSPCNNGQACPEPALCPEEQSSPNSEPTSEDDITLTKNYVAAAEDVMAESHSLPQSGGVGDNRETDSSASFVDSFVPKDKDANELTVPPAEDKEDETSDTSSVMDHDESADRSMSVEQATIDEVLPSSADALEDSSTSQIRDPTPEEESDSIEAAPTESEDVSGAQEDSPESSTSSPGNSDDENSGDEIEGDEIEVVEQVGAEDSLMSDDEDDVSLITEQPIRVENDTLSLRSLHEESETDMIRKFISKVAADKSAKAAAAAELENRSPPQADSDSPAEDFETPPKRTPLSEKSPNSPSPTKKRKLDELADEPGKEESPKMAGESPVTRTVKRRKALVENSEPPTEEGDDSEGAPRRSSRQRKTLINLKSAPSANSIAKSTIPVRMPGMEMMDTVRARNDQKDVAAVTRYNTRKNKGSALFPQVVLKKMEKMNKQGKEYVYSSSSVVNNKASETEKKKKNKGVRWAETLARFQDEASAPVNSKTRALSSSLLADVLKADAALDDDIDELADEPVVSSKKVSTPRVLKTAKSQIKSRTKIAPEATTSKPPIPKPKKVAPPPPTPTTRRAAAASSIPAPAPTPTRKVLPTPAPKPTTSIHKVTAPPKRATRSGKSLVPTPIKSTPAVKPKTTVPAAPPPPLPAPHRGPGRPRLNLASSTTTSTPISNKVNKTPAATSKTVVTAAARRASRVAAGLGMSVNGTPAPKRRGRSAS